jgi:hypothetical protein
VRVRDGPVLQLANSARSSRITVGVFGQLHLSKADSLALLINQFAQSLTEGAISHFRIYSAYFPPPFRISSRRNFSKFLTRNDIVVRTAIHKQRIAFMKETKWLALIAAVLHLMSLFEPRVGLIASALAVGVAFVALYE